MKDRAAVAALLMAVLAGCRDSEGDKFRMFDRDFVLAAGAHEDHGFVVFGEEHSLIEIHISAPEGGEGVDVLLLREGKRIEHLSSEAVKGARVLSGETHGDAYELRVVNRDKKAPVKAHVFVVRDLSR